MNDYSYSNKEVKPWKPKKVEPCLARCWGVGGKGSSAIFSQPEAPVFCKRRVFSHEQTRTVAWEVKRSCLSRIYCPVSFPGAGPEPLVKSAAASRGAGGGSQPPASLTQLLSFLLKGNCPLKNELRETISFS